MIRRGQLRRVVDTRGPDHGGRWWHLLACGHWAQRRRRQRQAYCRDCSARGSAEISGMLQ